MWNDPIEQEFNAAYLASLPSPVAEALKLKNGDRLDALQSLAAQGFIIDFPIMAWKFPPYFVMLQRHLGGMTWVPNAMQQPLGQTGSSIGLPGATLPGQTPYDPLNPPPGSIKVIDPRDRAQWPKPFTVPPPPPVAGINIVGERNPVWDQYGYGLGYNPGPDAVKDGKYVLPVGGEVTEDGATFIFRVVRPMIGEYYFFTLKG